jgi:hypothetical protein
MSRVREFRRRLGNPSSVGLAINAVDNQASVTLNGVLIALLEGPHGFVRYAENLSRFLRTDAPNVLVVTLFNRSGAGHNPAGIECVLHINDEEINLSESTGENNAAEGFVSESVVILY